MIILDTHVWIWWLTESEKLSSKGLKAIENQNIVGIRSDLLLGIIYVGC